MLNSSIAIPATFALALLPSLLPTWRGVLITAASLYVLLIGTFAWLLRQVDAMTSGEGPAFMGLMLLLGSTTSVLVGACLARGCLDWLLRCLPSRLGQWVQRGLLAAALCSAGLVAYAGWAWYLHRGVAMAVGMAALWLALQVWRTQRTSQRHQRA